MAVYRLNWHPPARTALVYVTPCDSHIACSHATNSVSPSVHRSQHQTMRRTAPPTRTVAQVTTAAVLLVVAAALAGTASAILIHEVPASGGGSERVHFATGVHRHGDRSPVGYFPKDPNNAFWPEGPGMLTPTGMQQLRILGATFRERYHMQYGLVDANYTRRDFVYRSTDYDRTLMSAYSFLNGLYPYGTGPIAQNDLPGLPDRMQPVPVHTIPQSEDNLLRGYSRAQCRQLEVEYDARKTSDEWAAMEAKHADVLAQLPALTGLDDVSIDRVSRAAGACQTATCGDSGGSGGVARALSVA